MLDYADVSRVPESLGLFGFRIIVPEIAALLGSLFTLIICTAFQTDGSGDANSWQRQQPEEATTELQTIQTIPTATESTNQSVLVETFR